MSHHSREVDEEIGAQLRKALETAGTPLGGTGDHPRGRLTPTDEGGIRIAVGSKNGAVVIDFGTPVAWIGFTPAQARQLAADITKHANHVDQQEQTRLEREVAALKGEP